MSPVVISRKYLPFHPVAGTVDHEQMSPAICQMLLSQIQGVRWRALVNAAILINILVPLNGANFFIS
jgi:hypothetical protein